MATSKPVGTKCATCDGDLNPTGCWSVREPILLFGPLEFCSRPCLLQWALENCVDDEVEQE